MNFFDLSSPFIFDSFFFFFHNNNIYTNISYVYNNMNMNFGDVWPETISDGDDAMLSHVCGRRKSCASRLPEIKKINKTAVQRERRIII